MAFCQDIYKLLCKRHPGSNIYVIGDHHFYHQNIISYTRSEFSSVEEMNNYIKKIHNETVDKNDIVIFLGDFCLKNSAIQEMVAGLNGHKYLILGNHDPRSLEKRYYVLGFEGVYVTPVKIENNYLSHEPLLKGERNDLTFQAILSEFIECSEAINYHGHIHTKDGNISSAYVNVSCEALDFKPILIGKTLSLSNDSSKPLFINSPYFVSVVDDIKRQLGFEQRLMLDDYIYSTMLESLSDYSNQTFIQGSFGLYKNYGYISRFSDLDVTCLYDPSKSKNKHYVFLKKISDEMYEHLMDIDGINLEFFKRFDSIRIFNASLVRPQSLFASCYSDMNLIPLDCFRSTDFQSLEGKSTVEKYLARKNSSLLNDYSFPQFSVQSLRPIGDISNLVLQVLFQKDNQDKKYAALRKLHYIYNRVIGDREIENLLDTFIRFFLRNISLLSLWGRREEVDYIKDCRGNLQSLMEPFVKVLPNVLLEQIYDVLTNPNSMFLSVYDEIISIPNDKAFKGCAKVMKMIK